MLSLAPPSEAVCAATRKRVMAEVVLQSRKRKADREQADVQDDMTALFRRVMCEPAIIQCLVRWLDFRALVTLVAFTDRNLRLRYATHHPGRHVSFVIVDRDQYRKVQDEHTKRIAEDSRVFDWSRRITEHLGTSKVYKAPNPYLNVLRLYLDDVRGAKGVPRGSVFKCLYCDNPDLVSPKNRNTYFLVNKQLSPLNCCYRCYKERHPGSIYISLRGSLADWDADFRELLILKEIKEKLAKMLLNDRAFLDKFDDQTAKAIEKHCFFQYKDRFLDRWPEFASVSDPSIMAVLMERREDIAVIRFELLQDVLERAMTAIKHILWDVYSRKYVRLMEGDIFGCLQWDARYVAYMNKNPEFKALFTPKALDILARVNCGLNLDLCPLERDDEPDTKKPKHNSDE